MSGTLYLITEGQEDGDLVKALLKRHYPRLVVKVLKPTGNSPNLSRLAIQIEPLLKTALRNAGNNDCVAVLHNADMLSQPERSQ